MKLEQHLKIYEELGYKVTTGVRFGEKTTYFFDLKKGQTEKRYPVSKRDYRKIYKFMTARKDDK